MIYVFDTNSYRVLGNYYPSRFPSFWQQFEELVQTGEVVSVREVYNELLNLVTEEWFLNWIHQHRDMFLVPTVEEMDFVAPSPIRTPLPRERGATAQPKDNQSGQQVSPSPGAGVLGGPGEGAGG